MLYMFDCMSVSINSRIAPWYSQLAKMEQQQKAINNLKLNLMDDLTDRGVLSNPECQRVIDVHKQVR